MPLSQLPETCPLALETGAVALLQALPAPTLLLGLDGRIILANPSAQRTLGASSPGADLMAMVAPEDRPTVNSYLDSLRAVEDGQASRYASCMLVGGDRPPRHVALTGAPFGHNGHWGILLSLNDITLQRQREAELEALSLTDTLTGLANRRAFMRSLRAAIDSGHGCVVAMADIDLFKQVNDQHGHALGDQVLAMVASRLVRALPPDAVTARLGGDEFAVLLPGDVDAGSLERLEALRHIELTSELGPSGPVSVSLSIGVTHTRVGDENAVLHQSDVAMYAAKRGGRAQVAVYGERMSEILQQHQTISTLVDNLRAQNERLHLEARTDARTGLANSRALGEVERQVVGPQEHGFSTCGVLFIDIDHFGAFNHLYGDHAGDLALQRVAEALRRAGRKTDRVFRKGGEEFVMVLPMADAEAVAEVARHLAACIADLRIPHADGPTGWLSALIVGTTVMAGQTIGRAVVRAGDAAMRCKGSGVRAQVVLVD